MLHVFFFQDSSSDEDSDGPLIDCLRETEESFIQGNNFLRGVLICTVTMFIAFSLIAFSTP